ncbi:MAG: nonstructural protein [Microviridae sp.]|nr:MAG: nonstructural protein [Microviridae sp.]
MKIKQRGQNYGQKFIFYLRQNITNICTTICRNYRWHCNTSLHGFITKARSAFWQISERLPFSTYRKMGRNRSTRNTNNKYNNNRV